MDQQSHLMITDDVCEKWIKSWKFATLNNDGNSFGENVKLIFMQSGLPQELLAQVWSLVDQPPSERLNLHQFFCAMYVLNLLRDGKLKGVPNSIPKELNEAVTQALKRSTTLEKLASKADLTASPQSPSSAGLTNANAVEISAEILPKDWTLYHTYFATLDAQKVGYLTGDQVRPFFMRSKLGEVALAYIWEAVDVQKKGVLRAPEFAVAMHLIKAYMASSRVKSGDVLPPVLPRALMNRLLLETSAPTHDPGGALPANGSSMSSVSSLSSAGSMQRNSFSAKPTTFQTFSGHPSKPQDNPLTSKMSSASLSFSRGLETAEPIRADFIDDGKPWKANLGTILATEGPAVDGETPCQSAFNDLPKDTNTNLLASLNSEVGGAQAQVQALEAERTNAEREQREQQDKVQRAKDSLNAALDRVAVLQADIKISKHQSELAATSIATLEAQLSAVNNESAALQSELDKLNRTLETRKAESDRVSAQILATRTEVDELMRSLDAQNKLLVVEEQMLQGAQAQLATLKLEKERLTQAAAAVTSSAQGDQGGSSSLILDTLHPVNDPAPPPRMKQPEGSVDALTSEAELTMKTAEGGHSPTKPAVSAERSSLEPQAPPALRETLDPIFNPDDFTFDADFSKAFPLPPAVRTNADNSTRENSPSRVVYQAFPISQEQGSDATKNDVPNSFNEFEAAFGDSPATQFAAPASQPAAVQPSRGSSFANFEAAFGTGNAVPAKEGTKGSDASAYQLISLDSQPSSSRAASPLIRDGVSTLDALKSMNLLEPPSKEVQVLLNMGFSRKQSEDALARYDNNLEKATDYLLSN